MRDTRKNKQYYEEYLNEEDQRIANYKDLVIKVQDKFPNDHERIKKAYGMVLSLSVFKLNALYSMGTEIETIKDYYYEVVEYMQKGWNSESYTTMLWMVSWGILLGASHESMQSLYELQSKAKKEDFLIEYLFHANNPIWRINTKKLLFPEDFKTLREVVQLEDKKVAINRLKFYLENEWYEMYDDTGWYESHNHSEKIYSGYWSYESGAIAKVLQLDDEALKNVPYYPYDLVHYRN
ncbi:PoNe immunity protein domain-containing protein [Listeria booriae]|uniref:PoNe immunity protein domain-containing protein n=1 Tax=Listeria booriae TaxID=1552123 RepID=UPI0016273CE7|nr:PoNe immunity protein domain-containing protein [Listeria booriae]MBC2327235.1 DUF1911 domain-containing protein [Listeria booriae]